MKTLVLLFSFITLTGVAASAKTYKISFAPFCDAMRLTTRGPHEEYVGGVHDLSRCLGSNEYNVYIGGFKHGFYTSIDPDAESGVMDLTDPSYGYVYGLPYPLEYLIDMDRTCAWSNYYDFEGTGHVLGNVGTCTFIKKGKAPAVALDSQPSFMIPKSMLPKKKLSGQPAHP
jgi:hypothetical protein